MTKREMEILEFMTQARIASTDQLQRTFFNGLHHSISYKVLQRLIDGKLIKRKYLNIGYKRNSYVYYIDKLPAKRCIKHDLLITEFLVKLKQYKVISFDKTPIVGGIIPDAEAWIQTNKLFGIFLEVQLQQYNVIKKYYNLKHKTHREIPNVLYIITDKEIPIQKLRDMKIIIDDLNMSRLKEVLE